MKTKNAVRVFILTLMLAISAPAVQASTPSENKAERIQQIEQRLEEIKEMDFKTLTKAERKELRGEVKELKKEMKQVSGGVYISVGAAILIALLIILLV